MGPTTTTEIIVRYDFDLLANISLLVVDTTQKISALMKNIEHTACLKTIVYVEEPTDEDRLLSSDKGVQLIHFQDVVIIGKNNPHNLVVSNKADG